MFHIYSSHPIAMNPFKSAFAEVFTRERDAAASRAEIGGRADGTSGQQEVSSKTGEDDDKGREQLVWVLWKILKGDGIDVSFWILPRIFVTHLEGYACSLVHTLPALSPYRRFLHGSEQLNSR